MLNLSQRKSLAKEMPACPGGAVPLNLSHNKWLSWFDVDKISLHVYLKGYGKLLATVRVKIAGKS
jgi:hypothetical protein